MAKSKTPSKSASPKTDAATGTYVYDAELGKVVKVSDRVPGLGKSGSADSGADAGPCGRTACGGGRCAGSA